jgi:hypothetical protein
MVVIYGYNSTQLKSDNITQVHSVNYTLFQAKYKVSGYLPSGETASFEETGLFRIDNRTGRTSCFVFFVKEDENVRKWVPVDEY